MLNPETLYIIMGDEDTAFPVAYGRTPDGEGMYWYDFDAREDAFNDVCEPTATRHFESFKAFEVYRSSV